MTLVAVSASYGAGGSRIAPAVARRLDVPFVDRAIPLQTADVPASEREVDQEDDSGASWLERALRGFIGAESSVTGPVAVGSDFGSEQLRRQSEDLLRQQAESGRGVILGRAAVAVLRDDPRVLRVRLDGPPDRRIDQAMRAFGVNAETAQRAVRHLDRTHDEYLREFYGADIHDVSLYHLVLDSTVLPLGMCADFIVAAAQAPRPQTHAG